MACQLVRGIEQERFEVVQETAQALRSIKGPICILTVCGRARQGKSYILNQLVSKLQGQPAQAGRGGRFAVGSTVASCTKGLWLWSRPIPRTLPNGQPYHLLLVDVEGIDAIDQTADYSNRLFGLALLLSSMLIYNQMGTIDESSVDNLASVCEFARIIRGRSGEGGDSAGADMLRDLSPSFLWLLRDFQFQLAEDGRQLAVRDYMEQVLMDAAGNTEAVRQKNQMRQSIKAVFPDRDCLALVRPLMDEAKLAKLDSMPASELRPEFKKGVDALVDMVKSRCRPKALRGGMLTGPALAALAETYCRVINEGKVPSIVSTWQSAVQTECRRALDAATDVYRTKIEPARSAQVGSEGLEATHTAALAEALDIFNKQAVGEPGDREPFLRRLREAAAATVEPLRQIKRLEAEARTTQKLQLAARQLMQAVRDEKGDLAAAEAQLHALLQELATDQTLGPEKYFKSTEFLAGQVVPELRRMLQDSRTRAAAAEGRRAQLDAKVAELTTTVQQLQGRSDMGAAAEAQLRRELSAAKSEASTAAARLAAAEARAEGATRELGALREQLAAARTETARMVERSEAEITRLRSELAQAKSQRAAAEAAAQQAATSRGVAAQQAATRDAELAARIADLEAARREQGTLRAEVTQLRAELEQQSSSLTAGRTTLSHLQQERDCLQVEVDELKRRLANHEQCLATAAAAVQPLLRSTPVATSAAPTNARGISGATPVAQVTPSPPRLLSGRKRTVEAAGLPTDLSKRGADVVMTDADDDVFYDLTGDEDEGGGGSAAAAAAGPSGVPGVSPSGRRRVTVVKGGKRKGAAGGPAAANEGVAAAAGQGGEALVRTPVAAPMGGGSSRGGGGGGGGEQELWLVEREVVISPRTSPGVPAGAARTGTGAGAQPPGTTGGRGAGSVRTTAASPLPSAAPTAAGRLQPPPNLEKMKVNEIKAWLLENGFGMDSFALEKERPTKNDWVALVRSKCGPL